MGIADGFELPCESRIRHTRFQQHDRCEDRLRETLRADRCALTRPSRATAAHNGRLDGRQASPHNLTLTRDRRKFEPSSVAISCHIPRSVSDLRGPASRSSL